MQHLPARRYLPVLTVTAAVIFLSGCAVNKEDCDPAAMRTAGLMSKIACDFSGAYAERAQDQQDELQQALRQQELLQLSIAQLQDEQMRIRQGITMQRAQRDRLVRSLNATLASIEQENQGNQALQQRIKDAQAEVERLNQLPQGASSQQLQQQIQTVEREIKELTDAVAPPARP